MILWLAWTMLLFAIGLIVVNLLVGGDPLAWARIAWGVLVTAAWAALAIALVKHGTK